MKTVFFCTFLILIGSWSCHSLENNNSLPYFFIEENESWMVDKSSNDNFNPLIVPQDLSFFEKFLDESLKSFLKKVKTENIQGQNINGNQSKKSTLSTNDDTKLDKIVFNTEWNNSLRNKRYIYPNETSSTYIKNNTNSITDLINSSTVANLINTSSITDLINSSTVANLINTTTVSDLSNSNNMTVINYNTSTENSLKMEIQAITVNQSDSTHNPKFILQQNTTFFNETLENKTEAEDVGSLKSMFLLAVILAMVLGFSFFIYKKYQGRVHTYYLQMRDMCHGNTPV